MNNRSTLKGAFLCPAAVREFLIHSFQEKLYSIADGQFHVLTQQFVDSDNPLTDDMARVLRKVKEFEFKNGWLGEYVFQDDRGRVYASRISDCAVNNTTTAEFHNKKSIHAIRRTLNSNMKCAGVSGTVAASLLGHTEKVNEENYTYDVSSMEEKSKFMECAGRV